VAGEVAAAIHLKNELTEPRGRSAQTEDLVVATLTSEYRLRKNLPVPLVGPRAAQSVEFSVTYATDKCVPFVWRKRQSRTVGIPAVTNLDTVDG